MKKIFVIILFMLNFNIISSQKIDKPFNEYCDGVINIGNSVYIVGTTKNVPISNGDDIIVIKYNFVTKNITSKTFGSIYNDRGYSINKTNDDEIVISGESWISSTYEQNSIILKLDTNLNLIWWKSTNLKYRDGGIRTKEISDKNFFTVGHTRSFLNHSITDVLIYKSNNNGDTIFAKAIDLGGNDFAFDFIELDEGKVLIAAEKGGFFVRSSDYDYCETHDADIYLIIIDSLGNVLNMKSWGGQGHDLVRKIIKSPFEANSFYLIGSTQNNGNSNFDILFLKFDSDLNEIWHKTYGTQSTDYGVSLAYNYNNSTFFILSTTTNSITNLPQLTILVVDLDGQVINKLDTSIENLTYSADLFILPDNKIFVVGYTGNDFDNYNIFSQIVDYNLNILHQNSLSFASYNDFVDIYYENDYVNFKINYEQENIFNYKFLIYNSVGQFVYQIQNNSNNLIINKSNFSKGVYLGIFYLDSYTICRCKFIVF